SETYMDSTSEELEAVSELADPLPAPAPPQPTSSSAPNSPAPPWILMGANLPAGSEGGVLRGDRCKPTHRSLHRGKDEVGGGRGAGWRGPGARWSPLSFPSMSSCCCCCPGSGR